MAYFPKSILPKTLAVEGVYEVDGSPYIYNAKDYNTHHRELISIEEFLIGKDTESGLQAYVDYLTASAQSILPGVLTQYTGTIVSGQAVPVPNGLVNTTATQNQNNAVTTINVVSTDGFPASGIITKFNPRSVADDTNDGHSYKDYSGFSSTLAFTNQEFISYTAKTSTSFTGCTRSVDGTTAIDIGSGENALIVPGRMVLSLYCMQWEANVNTLPLEVCLYYDAVLNVTGKVYAIDNTNITKNFKIGYCLTRVADFDTLTTFVG